MNNPDPVAILMKALDPKHDSLMAFKVRRRGPSGRYVASIELAKSLTEIERKDPRPIVSVRNLDMGVLLHSSAGSLVLVDD